jgi:hypothetical protein
MPQDFSKYLGVEVDTIERPAAPPTGHYFGKFQSWKGAERFYEGKGGPATPVIEVTLKCTGADEDAMEEDASAAEKAVNRLFTKDYQLNDEAGLFALRRLTSETCGVDTKGLALGDALDACKNSDIKFHQQPRAGKEEGQFFPNVTKILPIG